MKTFTDTLRLRRSLSVVQCLALAVLVLHVGQLVAPHVANAVQLASAQPSSGPASEPESEDEDALPNSARSAARSDDALVATPSIRSVSAFAAAQDCVAARARARAQARRPGEASTRLVHRGALLVRLLI